MTSRARSLDRSVRCGTKRRPTTLRAEFVGCRRGRGAGRCLAIALVGLALVLPAGLADAAAADADAAAADRSLAGVVGQVQPKIVKIYGVGGLAGLESYQSGLLVSAEGHVLTVWSYVLDTDAIRVVLDDGRRFEAQLLGADPRLEMAVLKISAAGLDHFNMNEAVPGGRGARVLAFSNLYGVATGDEPVSVQHGTIAAVASLAARRGVYRTPYDGPVYVLDAMTNNPGAAGGALVNRRGELLGMLGKELRSTHNNTWLNYAVPIEQLSGSVADILAGRTPSASTASASSGVEPVDLSQLGVVLVPDVLPRTPPFIDLVQPGSAAEAAGLRPDDLVVLVDGRLVSSCRALLEELSHVDRRDPLRITVMRGDELLEVTLTPLQR